MSAPRARRHRYRRNLHALLPLLIAGAAFAGCLPWAGMRTPASGSLGTVSRGLLGAPRELPRQGPGYRFYRGGDRRFGTAELTGLLERTAARVGSAHPGSTLLIGDLSARRGGFVSGHHSHRSGRDADLAFFVSTPDGTAVNGLPLTRFDRFGAGRREDETCRFDVERNWTMVAELLRDTGSEVQWIFVSRGLKALLLEWGLNHGADIELIERAVSVLHQPSDSAPHDDHFHVRVYCGAGTTGDLCQDLGPRWPWVEHAPHERPQRRTDAESLALALDGLD